MNLKNKTPISVAIITMNEADRLPSCLKSAKFADEIIVVDSGSSDKSIEIAKSFDARVYEREWRGFSAQKQFAVEQCRNRWVFILDADESIPGNDIEVIEDAIAAGDKAITAYSFRRKNFFHGKWIRRCGWWPDRIVRLVDKEKGRFDGRNVHEGWLTHGKVMHLDSYIEHRSFRNYSEFTAKMDRYSTLAARDLFHKGAGSAPFTPALHGFWMFLRTYILEMGILEGFDGFMISIMNAGGSFMKYAKLREMWIKKSYL